MKTKIYPLLFAALLVSCAGEELSVSGYDAAVGGEELTPVAFSVQTNSPQTRTANGGNQWLTTDRIGIFMYTTGATLSDASISEGATNRAYMPQTAAASSALTPSATAETIYFPESGTVDFTAYYPWKATGTGAGEINAYLYPIDLSDQSDPAAIDLLYAKQTNRSKDAPSVSLTFAHQLSKITLHIKKGANLGAVDLSSATAVLGGTPATAAFSLVSGAITSTGVAANIPALKAATPATGFDAGFEVLILPQTTGSSRKVTFTAGGNDYEWQIPDESAFEAGINHSYALSVHPTGVETEDISVAPIGSITPWINDDHSTNGVIETVRVPAGTFLKGSPATEPNRGLYNESQHTVTLTQDFLIGKYEITNAQYAAFLNAMGIEGVYDGNGVRKAIYGGNTLFYQYDNRGVYWDVENNRWIVHDTDYGKHPVVDVTWYGADEFARWAGGSLPTEAQWEYACRAVSATPFGVGDGNSLYADQANFNGRSPYALPGGTIYNYPGNEYPNTYLETTAPVGSYTPNAWGIYDMHGNVMEWCSDWYNYDDVSGTVTDPVGPTYGLYRVVRGGGYSSTASGCRSAYRDGLSPSSPSSSSSYYYYSSHYGFRVVFPAQ